MRGLLTSAYQSLKIQIKNSTLDGQKKLLLVKQTLIPWKMIYPVDSAIQPSLTGLAGFGQAKRASRERASEALAASPLARAFSRDSFHSPR